MTARAAVCVVLVATALAGCGGGSDESPNPPSDPDTVGLPSYIRESVACLREAGIKVRVPAALRRLIKRQKNEGEPLGAEAGFLTFLSYDRKQKLTPTQLQAARTCTEGAR